jgi:CDP-diacylglycerol--glycerol-3-phosphate 3-phosphatidyltransferase
MKSRENLKHKIFNIPNLVSSIRVFLIPFYLFYIYKFYSNKDNQNYYHIVLVIIFLAVLSDFLDGMAARILNEETIVGRYLDPVCDKLVTTVALCSLSYYFYFPVWVVMIHLTREMIGVWFGTFLYYKRDFLQAKPNLWGKSSVVLITIIVLNTIIGEKQERYLIQNEMLIILFLLITLVGSIQYIYDYRKELFKK